MMKVIAIYGSGAYGQEIALLIEKINSRTEASSDKWNLVGFFDDNEVLHNSRNEFGPVLGGIDSLNVYKGELSLVIAIANPGVLISILGKIKKNDIKFPNIIDPDTEYLHYSSIKIGRGNIIGSGCRLSPNVCIGDFNIIVNDCVLGHDVKIGDYNILFPEVRISGKTIVGNRNLFGMRTAAYQGIVIGDDIKVSAGSIIASDAQSGFVYSGNPARKFSM